MLLILNLASYPIIGWRKDHQQFCYQEAACGVYQTLLTLHLPRTASNHLWLHHLVQRDLFRVITGKGRFDIARHAISYLLESVPTRTAHHWDSDQLGQILQLVVIRNLNPLEPL